jgi:crotonobetainyl-CoA:carnitine CoA-transferase CaiB-like acyl-CoA transferase
MAGPLSGIKILDLTTVAFGPYATQILADYGAEVIKVESPEGDITRAIAPMKSAGMGHFFLMSNRNKRCIVLDLKSESGRKGYLKLAEGVDAIVCSVRPAAMARLGLGYEDCKAVNPNVVYMELVGFGQAGPYAKRPAYDDIIQGMSGMAAMQGGREGPPRFVNSSVCDKIGSQFIVHATMAALFHKERTGEGQLVEVPMLESMVGFNMVEHQSGQCWDPALGEAGYERSMVEYRRPYATADGHVCVLPYNTKQWRAFFELMERPELVDDPRVNDAKARSENIGDLYVIVAECVANWPTEKLLKALDQADIPNGPATPLGELADDPHLQAVGLFQTFDHPTEGRIRLVGPAATFSKTQPEIRTLPAGQGAHSVEVLREVGYGDVEIEAMLDSGATLDGRPAVVKPAAK